MAHLNINAKTYDDLPKENEGMLTKQLGDLLAGEAVAENLKFVAEI